MSKTGYQGYLGIEYVWIDWEHCNESDNISETVLFRDFLRADGPTRDAYAALKRELAGRYHDDRIAYNEAKANFILDAMERSGCIGVFFITCLPIEDGAQAQLCK